MTVVMVGPSASSSAEWVVAVSSRRRTHSRCRTRSTPQQLAAGAPRPPPRSAHRRARPPRGRRLPRRRGLPPPLRRARRRRSGAASRPGRRPQRCRRRSGRPSSSAGRELVVAWSWRGQARNRTRRPPPDRSRGQTTTPEPVMLDRGDLSHLRADRVRSGPTMKSKRLDAPLAAPSWEVCHGPGRHDAALPRVPDPLPRRSTRPRVELTHGVRLVYDNSHFWMGSGDTGPATPRNAAERRRPASVLAVGGCRWQSGRVQSLYEAAAGTTGCIGSPRPGTTASWMTRWSATRSVTASTHSTPSG